MTRKSEKRQLAMERAAIIAHMLGKVRLQDIGDDLPYGAKRRGIQDAKREGLLRPKAPGSRVYVPVHPPSRAPHVGEIWKEIKKIRQERGEPPI